MRAQKCEEIKELILTDYLDGQLKGKMAGEVEVHLLDCKECRTFFKEAKHTAFTPFLRSALQPVPRELWRAIKDTIEQEARSNPWEEFIAGLKGWLVVPKLVPVLGSLIVMLVAGSITVNTIQVHQARDKDQGEYLVALLTPPASTQAEGDLGTPIEHYFL